jgi:hypothetical protein
MLKIVKTSLVIAATLGVSGVAQADVNEALSFKQTIKANYVRKCVQLNLTIA